jgi:hypothetical protein
MSLKELFRIGHQMTSNYGKREESSGIYHQQLVVEIIASFRII